MSELLENGTDPDRVANCFGQYRNFRVLKDVPLTPYGKHLPDIDIIAVSYEPSLGFHLYIAELKNNLPATWSKDYLKSIGKKDSSKRVFHK